MAAQSVLMCLLALIRHEGCGLRAGVRVVCEYAVCEKETERQRGVVSVGIHCG